MFWIYVTIIIPVSFYVWLKNKYKYWSNQGVRQGNPTIILGDNWEMVFRRKSVPEMVQDFYNISPESRYVGVYGFLNPSLIIRDPDLIKQMTVKDFDHFVDHYSFIPEDAEPLFGQNLFSLTGQKWHNMRSTLSPAFTSSKMKYMFSLINQTGERFANYFLKRNEDIITIDMKETFSRFTTDVIGNTAFGIECDSLSEANNEFYLWGKEASDFKSIRKVAKFFLYRISERIYKLLKLRLFPAQMVDFFLKVVKDNIASREKHGIVRPDMINLLMEARKSGLKYDEIHTIPDAGFASVEESEIGKKQKTGKLEITDEDITAQAFLFFLGGFETVSTAMCFLCYELAVNPDIQERLKKEIFDTLENCKDKLTYEALTGMKYLDMVVSETLRKWPNGIALDRVCVKPYTIEPKLPNEKPIYLPEKSVIIVPIYGLHRDPKYFPNPQRFDPERFSDANKEHIKPYTFLPFGVGPRGCLGSRFGLLELKILFFHLVKNFEIVPVEQTTIPLKFCKKTITMAAEGGFWCGLKRHEN